MHLFKTLLLLSALSACAAPSGNGNAALPSEPEVVNETIAVSHKGLSGVGGDALRYGTPRDAVIAVLQPHFDPPLSITTNEECGAGPIVFVNYDLVSLNFQQGVFVGWWFRTESALRTDRGIGLGSRWSEVQAVYPQVEEQRDSTLGREFYILDDGQHISGLLDGDGDDALVTDLWGGTNCIFR
ncbi:MAG: hypothetical protein AAFX04_01400 [Pseudomonadota bacterium]